MVTKEKKTDLPAVRDTAQTEKKKSPSKKKSSDRYIESVGRRKTAVARVRITPAQKNSFVVNDIQMDKYFPTKELQSIAQDAIKHSGIPDKFTVTALIKGGGVHAQAEALRHGIARGLVEHNAEIRKDLKKLGFLKRDPRTIERKKFGLKKARRAPQWSKR